MYQQVLYRMRAEAAGLRHIRPLLYGLLLALLFQPLQGQAPTKQEKKALEKKLEGTRITAKIDLPLLRSMVVYPNGEMDARIYREKLSKFPVSVHRFETATLRDISIKDDRLEVSINAGGLPRANRNVLKWTDPYKAGTRIRIEFGRKLRSQDMDPGVVVTALANIMEIEGFDVAAVRPVQAQVEQGSAPPATLALPTVRLQAIEVQPPRLAQGQTIQLIMWIDVKGMIGANRIEVAEELQIFFNGRPLLDPPRIQTEAWGNGNHSITRKFTIPATTEAGIYTFAATVRSGAGSASKEAVFVVTGSNK